MEFDELSRHVIGCAIEVHRNLGPGLLESTDFARLRLSDRLARTCRSDCRNQKRRIASSHPSGANSYVHATGPGSAWLAHQFQRHKTAKRHQTFRSVSLRALRVLRGQIRVIISSQVPAAG